MKLKIDKISRKEIDTKYGKKWKLSVLSDNKWYGAWAQPWNRGWREGQTIDAEVKERDWNGKPQYDIVGCKVDAPYSEPSSELDSKITQIMIEVLEIKKMVAELSEKEPF